MQIAPLLLATVAAAKPFQMAMQHRETEAEAGEYPLPRTGVGGDGSAGAT